MKWKKKQKNTIKYGISFHLSMQISVDEIRGHIKNVKRKNNYGELALFVQEFKLS